MMTTKTKANAKSRIIEAVHETAGDLHRFGFIDKRNMMRCGLNRCQSTTVKRFVLYEIICNLAKLSLPQF